MKILNILSEQEKSVEAVLQFFDESDQDDKWQYYDIKDGLTAHWKHEEVFVIAISHDGQEFAIHTEARGELQAQESTIANLAIYKLQRVY